MQDTQPAGSARNTSPRRPLAASILGLLLGVALVLGAWQIAHSVRDFRLLDRSVEVKGLSEREVPADLAIWPIAHSAAGNDVAALYRDLDRTSGRIVEFLAGAGFPREQVSVSPPHVVDKQAREWGDPQRGEFRYTGRATITVYTPEVERVRATMSRLVELGTEGIVLGSEQGAQPQFLFTKLNEIKPSMLEEATRNARAAATKFAEDSGSRLGSIRRASQGQFSIADRDASTPHIKKVRVVSTIDYYLE
ncbi:MAG: SIMPL domain-containing protein [Burkholderiaceae bacterium]|nr:SIMPL domain-containing protein [Burkholderiaceae bacterium]